MTLLAPLFLLGLLAAAIPLLVHRMQEQHAPVKDFPSSRFLEETRKNTSRRRKLRYRWLLAARIALLCLLSALFAEPILQLAKKFLGDNTAHHVIVIDDSFSMRHGDRWQDALGIAGELVDEYSGSADVSFLLASDRALQPGDAGGAGSLEQTDEQNETDSPGSGPSPERELKDQLQHIETLEPTLSSFDYSQIMDAVDRVAERFVASEKDVHLHLISDLQRSAARVPVNRLYRETLEAFEMHRVGSDDDANVSLGARASWLNPSTARIDTEVRLSRALSDAQASVDSDQTTSTVQIQIAHGSDILAEESIELIAGETYRKSISVSGVDEIARRTGSGSASTRVGEETGLSLTVSVVGALADDDLLADDNQVLLNLPDNSPLQVAVYAADPLRQQRDLAYIDAAYRQMHNVEVQVIDSRSSRIPEQTDLLIALHRSGETEVTPAVEEFRRNGGALLQVLGGSIFSSNASSGSGDERITRVDQSHPLGLAAGRGDWLDVSFSQAVWRGNDLMEAVGILDGNATASNSGNLQSDDNGDAAGENQIRATAVFNTDWLDGRFRVLLATQSGVPVLIEAFSKAAGSAASNSQQSGSADGNSQALTAGWLVLTVPLDGVSSNLPVNPVFVPFLHQVTDYLLQQGRYPAALSAGDSLMLAANTQLLSPQGESVFDFAANSRRRSHLFDQPGTYTLLEARGSHQIQVGIEAAESDIQVLSSAAQQQWQVQYETGTDVNETDSVAGSNDDDSVGTAGDSSSANSAAQFQQTADSSDKRQLPLWQWLLPSLLILLLIEAITANRVLQRFRASV